MRAGGVAARSPGRFARTGVRPDFPGNCPSGYFCVATGANYTGTYIAFLNGPSLVGGNYWIAWGQCPNGPGCNVGVHSWANNSGYRTWLEQFQNRGNLLCISNGTANSNYNGVDDHDYWILMTSNTAGC